MNELLNIRLNTAGKKQPEIRGLNARIVKMMTACGLRAEKQEGKFRPINVQTKDESVRSAIRELEKADWLKGILVSVKAVHKEIDPKFAGITVANDIEIDKEKLANAEAFLEKYGTLPGPVVIDGNGALVGEAEIYRAAMKFGVLPEIIEVPAGVQIEKHVYGRAVHLSRPERAFVLKTLDKMYYFNYDLKEYAQKDDILNVKTRFGTDQITVCGYDYCYDPESIGVHQPVLGRYGVKLNEKLTDTLFEEVRAVQLERRAKVRETKRQREQMQKAKAARKEKMNRRKEGFTPRT